MMMFNHKNRWWLLVLLISWHTQAIDLVAKVKNQQLQVNLSNINYPGSFIEQELDSGLPNTVSLFISLSDDRRVLHGLTVNYQIVYDLWDEVYRVGTHSSDGVKEQRLFNSKETLLAYLTTFERRQFGYASQNAEVKGLQLSAQAIVNPVKTERIKKIQAWIANSKGFDSNVDESKGQQVVSNSPTGSFGARASSASGPRFQKLFDQILEQYIDSDAIPALWRSERAVVTVK